MRLVFTESAYYLWFQDDDRKLARRINTLIRDALRTPFAGLGKPAALRSDLSGYWSRRSNSEKRLVYSVSDNERTIIACRSHCRR